MKKQFVIVGGGTAGWLAALYYQKYHNNIFDITVIESSKIGIVGVGEGATFQLIAFLDSINIPVSDLVKHTGATIKSAIKFTNWLNDGSYFYHGFIQHPQYDAFYSLLDNNRPLILLNSIANSEDIKLINLTDNLCDLYKVPFIKNNSINNTNNIFDFDQYSSFSLHFNTNKLGQYLKSIGISRGIKTIDAIVVDQTVDEAGFIRSLNIDNNATISTDFVVDCTGFSRYFIKGIYNSPWISYQKYLPVNKAIPFFVDIPKTEKIPPYTEAIAMKYGWVWKIPVQDRFGCGYVFDSSSISREQALEEAEHLFNQKLESPRTISFEAGTFTKAWNKNCLALGLAAGFIEPLESTSIWSTINSILAFSDRILDFDSGNEQIVDDYNKFYSDMNQEIFEFVYMHYLTKRTDTDFWKKFHRKDHPENLIKNLNRLNSYSAFNGTVFGKYFLVFSWIHIAYNMKLLDTKLYNDLYTKLTINSTEVNTRKQELINNIYKAMPLAIDHREFLEYLKR